ncbi:MAG: hypothetical protein HFI39_00770 [Lachnospiraceae bacterium]|nr:hypothetical protein [Lachnospiraceae bacterium]
MAKMQELMQSSLSAGNPVLITLKNGKELSGVLESFDEDLFFIRFSNGRVQPVAYELVGMYERPEDMDAGESAPAAGPVPMPGSVPAARTEPIGRAAPADRTAPMTESVPAARTAPVGGAASAARTESMPGSMPAAKTELMPGAVPAAKTVPMPGSVPADRTAPIAGSAPAAGTASMAAPAPGAEASAALGALPAVRPASPTADSLEPDRQIGYIILYMVRRGYGYIVQESDYRKKRRGDIYFTEAALPDVQNIDTRQSDYRVSFRCIPGFKKQAADIRILEQLPKYDVDFTEIAREKPVDFGGLDFRPGETLVLVKRIGRKCVGRYLSHSADHISVRTADGTETGVRFSELEALFFCGLITSFNVLSSSGQINNSYTFRITNVVNKQLAHLLKLGKYSVYPCIYSLMMDGTTSYISTVDYFTKDICEQLSWQAGRILGLYKTNSYFSVEQENRCYESAVVDNTIHQFLSESDYLGQEVFYKTVYHRTADERRRGGLSASVVDIRSKYQIGKVAGSTGGEQRLVQCGSQIYGCSLDMDSLAAGSTVKIELACREGHTLYVEQYGSGDLSLPSYVKKNQQEKSVFDAKVRQAGMDQNYDLQITLTEEMLARAFISPERALGVIFKIGVCHDRLERAAGIVDKYGYMAAAPFLNGLRMQLETLAGKKDSAMQYARGYLADSGKTDEFLISVAREILHADLSPQVLREHIESGQPFQHTRSTGTIGYFNAPTKAGYILWEGGKLNFSHKDLENYSDSPLDPERFAYQVTFEVDHSKAIPKAGSVRIYERTAREDGTDSAQGEDAFSYDFAYDQNFWENEIPSAPSAVMTLLEFKRDTFDLNSIAGYLPREERSKIKNGAFAGSAEEAEALICLLRNSYEKRPDFYRTTPVEIRPNFLLMAAKLHQAFARDAGEDGFFSEKTGKSILFDYAFRYLSGNNAREQAEVEYYCESIFRNDFAASIKCRMEARCLAEFFAETKGIDLNGCGERSAIVGILRRSCTDLPGLSKMLLNLPEPVLEELLECARPPLLEDVARTIVARLANGAMTKDMDRKEAIKQYYTNYHSYLDELREILTNPSRASIDNIHFLLEKLEETAENVGKYLFELDEKWFERTSRIISDIKTSLQNEEVDGRTDRLRLAWRDIQNTLGSIEEHPSRLSFEFLRPFLLNIRQSVSGYLNSQYKICRPRLTVRHYGLRNNGRQETIEISNEEGCLPAINVKVVNAVPYGRPKGFFVDMGGSRNIVGNGQQIHGGKAAEINIPILVDFTEAPDVLELSLTLSYEYMIRFDGEQGAAETKAGWLTNQKIQIPLNISKSDFIYENPYALFAGGGIMRPDNEDAQKMFFGRTEDISEIVQMLTDGNGQLKTGSIVAIYGQKRCGKSSVMYFLGRKIEEEYPNTIVLDINAQNVGVKNNEDAYYRGLLSTICTSFQIKLRRNKQLQKELREAGICALKTENVVGEYGEEYFQEFFQNFREQFGKRYTILLMVDEFTQIYIHMKRHAVSEDFLNRWRAMIQTNGFVNIVVGQDFMDKFTMDEDIATQNFGGAVNGLGTMGRKRLSYLGGEAARKMIETPILLADGSSRYRGQLGQEAISYIYDLTGGSAFYLMKFCNALVDYMIDNQEQLVTRGLVDTVAESYVFDTPNDPITKLDFDPIFNEYSYRDDQDEEDISVQVRDEIKKTYQILKRIADLADSQGICSIRRLLWPDLAERDGILRSLMVRGVLTDQNGRDITTEQIGNLDIKIKVRLFAIWLKKRG